MICPALTWPALLLLPAAVATAKKQLVLAARVLVFALHAANAPLLAAQGPLSVEGTISAAVQGRKLARVEGQRVDVSCAALPATAGTTMVLRTEFLKL